MKQKNRDVLTGTLSGKYKITVADGAFVILRDVTISGGKKEDATSRPVRWCILPRNMFCTRT